MKKIFTKSIITTLVCSMLVVTAAGCSNGTNAELSSSTPTETQATQAQTTAPEGVNFNLDALHAPLENPADPFAGYWRIAEGAGSKLESFTFCLTVKAERRLLWEIWDIAANIRSALTKVQAKKPLNVSLCSALTASIHIQLPRTAKNYNYK